MYISHRMCMYIHVRVYSIIINLWRVEVYIYTCSCISTLTCTCTLLLGTFHFLLPLRTYVYIFYVHARLTAIHILLTTCILHLPFPHLPPCMTPLLPLSFSLSLCFSPFLPPLPPPFLPLFLTSLLFSLSLSLPLPTAARPSFPYSSFPYWSLYLSCWAAFCQWPDPHWPTRSVSVAMCWESQTTTGQRSEFVPHRDLEDCETSLIWASTCNACSNHDIGTRTSLLLWKQDKAVHGDSTFFCPSVSIEN